MARTNHLIAALAWASLLSSPLCAGEPVDFARDIQPLLENHCWKCHGADKQQGSLRLDHRAAGLGAGDSGEAAVLPGKPDDSVLIHRVEAADAEERMPAGADPLSPEQIKTLRDWIEQGAEWPETDPPSPVVRRQGEITPKDREHWSYRPLRTVDPPTPNDSQWVRTTVDRFILAALEGKGIQPNPPADRRTLIRRVYFDVIGLPPSPEEVQAFVADPSPQAYQALVDRLLSSTHYGERWARHWLDVARYADSSGMEGDHDRPNAYHYRDFVIRALNEDLSFQTFARWQIAGDEYEPENPLAVAATGFLTAAPSEVLNVPMEDEKLRLRYNELDDMAATTASAFLGLTLACARCHDHKFDAIPTSDYYRIQCAFTTTARGEVPLATRAELEQYHKQESEWKQRLSQAQKTLADWLTEQKSPHTAALRNARIQALPIGDEEKNLLKEQPDSDAAKKLAAKHEKRLAISDDDYRKVFSDEQRVRWDGLTAHVDSVQRSQPNQPTKALAIVDKSSQPELTWLLERGDFHAKKSQVQLGFLSVLTGSRPAEDFWTAARQEAAASLGPSQQSTLQRRALADWMMHVEHGAGALAARVIVNRAWQHHFGEGLVRTVGDFGVRGERPTHPELMEWLAHQFVAEGWKLKPLHRLILTSAAYMQDTTFDEKRQRVDPENRLLWRRRPQRLEAETLRDSVLAVSGQLNPEQFGPAFKPPIPREAMVARNTKDPYPTDAQDTPATRRRTVYMYHKRVVQHPLMQAFDGPDAAVTCNRRSITTVAPQALALLNDAFIRDRASDFARRVLAEAQADSKAPIERAFHLALARGPSETELAASVEFLDRRIERRTARDQALPAEEVRLRALADFCQALFGLNEFIYID